MKKNNKMAKIEEDAKKFYIENFLENYESVNCSDYNDLSKNQVLEKSKSCADIIYRDLDGDLNFIEIKATKVQKGKKAFGAITQTEMQKAIEAEKNCENYSFVFIIKNSKEFIIGKKLTLKDLLENELLSRPPEKYYFNIDPQLTNNQKIKKPKRNIKTKIVSKKTIEYNKKLNEFLINARTKEIEDIKICNKNFFYYLTLLLKGDLKNDAVEISILKYIKQEEIDWILEDYKELKEKLQELD